MAQRRAAVHQAAVLREAEAGAAEGVRAGHGAGGADLSAAGAAARAGHSLAAAGGGGTVGAAVSMAANSVQVTLVGSGLFAFHHACKGRVVVHRAGGRAPVREGGRAGPPIAASRDAAGASAAVVAARPAAASGAARRGQSDVWGVCARERPTKVRDRQP